MNRLAGFACSVIALSQCSAAPAPAAHQRPPSVFLRANLIVTDVGFLVYWFISAVGLLPEDWLYKDAANPILMAWNWSFAPVDLAASISGIAALSLARRPETQRWRTLALLSSALTFCAGLMAVSFWTLRQDFEVWWWLPNIYLVLWPLAAARELLAASAEAHTGGQAP